MKGIISALLGIFCFLPMVWGQNIRVVDEKLQGIEGAVVVGEDQTTFRQTDWRGEVAVAPFQKSDTIFIQHPAYQDRKVSVEDLASQGWTVELIEDIVRLDEAVVLVNRWEQKPEEIPQQMASLQPDDIRFNNPGTAADALEQTGQVFVQRSQLGGGSPMIRGFAANSVLIVVDGIRMNNAIYRSGNLQNVISIDPAMIGEAEVVFGPSSVIYGSDALGGVMDFHTFVPAYSTDEKFQTHGEGFVRFSSAAREKTGHARVDLQGERWSSLTSVTYSDFGDLRSGANRPDRYPDFGKRFNYVVQSEGQDTLVQNSDVNRQVPSGYQQINVMQKLRFRPISWTDITYGLLFSTTSDIPRYDRLIVYDQNGLPDDAEWYYGPQRWMLHYLKGSFYNTNAWYDQAKLTVGYQNVEESRHDRGFRSARRRSRTEAVGVWTLNLDLDKQWSDTHQLFYGGEYVYNDVQSTAFRENIESGEQSPASTRYPDGGSRYRSLAAYANHQWNITEKTTLTTGLRYSYVWLDAMFDDKTFYDFPFDQIEVNAGALSGSVGTTYRPNERWKLSALVSSGFRAPNVDDVGKVFDSEPGNVVVPNPNLSPEYSYNGEVGATLRLTDQWQVSGVLYASLLRNAMVRRNFAFNGQDSIPYDGSLSNVQAIVNAGKAYIWGYSAQLQGRISQFWTVRATWANSNGRDTDNDLPLRHVTPWFGRSSVAYQRARWRGELFVRYNGPVAWEDLPPSEQGDAYLYTEEGALAWYTLNVMAAYDIIPEVTVQAGIENIFDRHYRPYSSGISAPGRNIVVSVRGRF